MRERFEQDGHLLLPALIGADDCAALAALVRPAQSSAGTRCLLVRDWCAALARRVRADLRMAAFLDADSVAVQCTYFEKSPQQNWLVPVHQDLSIPVAARVEGSGLRGWSSKEGTLFVQPPASVLERLLAVRIHLDPCGPDDGPLRVVPGSHRGGVIAGEAALTERDRSGETVCCAAAGDALLLRPLLLHASSKSTGTSRRRVLHMVFGPPALPHGLSWNTAV